MRKIVTYVFVFAAIAASFSLAAYAQQSQEELDADRAIESIERAIEELRTKKTLTDEDKKLIEALHKSKKRLQDMKAHVTEGRSELGKLNKQANSILKRLNDAKLADAEKAIGKKRFTKAAKLLSEVLEADPDNAKARKTLDKILKSVCPAQYRYRHSKEFFRLEGGSPGTESAVTAALRWLHFHQDKDGRWDQDGFQKNCDTRKSPTCDGQGTSQYDVGVTGLALLAYLGNGHTHWTGPFKKTIRRGLDWLANQQQEDGSLGPRLAESWIYNHAIGTLALCEAHALTRDPKLKKPCEKAVEFILKARNKGLGWKYEPKSGRNDTSVTGWMVMALDSARNAGFKVPDAAFKGALGWFDSMTDGKGKTGYCTQGGESSVIRGVSEHWEKQPVMTALAAFCRILCGQKRNNATLKKSVELLGKNLPNWNKPKNDKLEFYYWFFGTNAAFQYGGKSWQIWNIAMKRALLDTQRIGGCADGSWDPVGKWGMVGGRVYATAINCLTLEVYYRYARAGAEEKKPSEDKKKDSSDEKTKQDK